MKILEKIARDIIDNNKDLDKEILDSNKSFFNAPNRGDMDYFSFNNFTNKQELSDILKNYLSQFNLTDSNIEDLVDIAYKLNESKEDESGDLSEFIYVMS